MITADELKRLRALCDTAHPGPWSVQQEAGHGAMVFLRANTSSAGGAWCPLAIINGAGIATEEFIAQSRTLVPRLLDEIERMQAVVEATKAWHSAGGNPCGEPGCGCTECALFAAVDALLAAERLNACTSNECAIRKRCTYPTACRSAVLLAAERKETP
jgi:hypothetical protein